MGVGKGALEATLAYVYAYILHLGVWNTLMALSSRVTSGTLAMAPTQGMEGHNAHPSSALPDYNNHGYSFVRANGSSISPDAEAFGNSTNNLLISAISHKYGLPVMIVVAVLLFLLIIATIVGNLLVIVALFRYRTLRSVSNYLIGNLAVSDFLLAVTILPMSAVNECLGYWVFGDILCQFWLVADVLYCTASIWNLCIIAFDRFTATLYPLWYREKRTVKQGIVYIVIVWVFSFAICVPPLLGWNNFTHTYVYSNETDTHECILYHQKEYVIYSASGSFYIPFLITLFLYIRIFGVLRHRIRKMRASGAKRNKHNKPGNKAKMNEKTPTALSSRSSPSAVTETEKETQEIELNKVGSDGHPVENESHSNKSLYGSDSQGENRSEEDEDSAQVRSDHPLYVSSSEAEGLGQVAKNGINSKGTSPTDRQNMHPPKCAETLVLNNPNNKGVGKVDKESDQDHIQIVVTEDSTTVVVPNNNKENPLKGNLKSKFLSVSKEVLTRNDSEKSVPRKSISNQLRHVNPFKKDREKSRSSQKQRRFDQREVRATIRMAIIIAFFCGCWLGFFIIYVVRAFCPYCYIPGALDAFMFWLGYSNSAMNPILYTIFNDDFRKAFQKLLGCHKRNTNGSGNVRAKH